jgi:hypothetical protein
MGNAARWVNAAIAFLLELAMLAAFGWAGYELVGGPPWNWIAAASLPGVAGVIWSFWAAPKSRRRLQQPMLLGLELGLMLLSAAGLWITGQLVLAGALAVLAVITQFATLVGGEVNHRS